MQFKKSLKILGPVILAATLFTALLYLAGSATVETCERCSPGDPQQ
ncbi:MAG: hypothetical protein JRJ16_08485 [Deltaproteobacteria bacterium]|nr:hypothetical protein [Deltaproteobacteria bacterium]